MKKFLLTLFIAAGLTQTTQGQVGCDDMNLIVNVSYEDYVNIYHPGHYLTSPTEENVITWTITDNQDNIVAQETLTDEAIFAFNHNIPTSETMNVSALLINEVAGVACMIEDLLYWEETEVIPGVFTYRWEFLYGNVGTLGINDLIAPTVSLYPNPSNDLINISFDKDQLQKIELYDTTGKLLFKSDLNTNTYALNIANYPSGVYFVRVFNQNNVFVNKQIIKK